jgi:hypothetical protein
MSESTSGAKSFSVGERVRWSSDGGGYRTVKEGEVMVVVPPGQTPRAAAGPGFSWTFYRVMFDGRDMRTRAEESYLVRVPARSAKAKDRLYWPRTMWLEESAPD